MERIRTLGFFHCFPISMMAMAVLIVVFFLFLTGASSVAALRHPKESLSRKELAEMAGYGEDKISTILVTGSVLCDYMRDDNGQHLPSSQPVPGAVVGFNCGGSRRSRRRSSSSGWTKGVTDEYGDFTIDLPSSLHAIPNLHKKCSLKLLQLPNNNNLSRHCIKPSNSKHHTHHGKGINMILLLEEDGARTYSTGTIRLLHHHPISS